MDSLGGMVLIDHQGALSGSEQRPIHRGWHCERLSEGRARRWHQCISDMREQLRQCGRSSATTTTSGLRSRRALAITRNGTIRLRAMRTMSPAARISLHASLGRTRWRTIRPQPPLSLRARCRPRSVARSARSAPKAPPSTAPTQRCARMMTTSSSGRRLIRSALVRVSSVEFSPANARRRRQRASWSVQSSVAATSPRTT